MVDHDTQYKNITQLCPNFPVLDNPIIHRNNLIDTINRLFISNSVVFLEGEPNVGKTILSAEFAERNCENTICIYIKSGNRWSTDISSIRSDIYTQIQYYLYNSTSNTDHITSQDNYTDMIYALTRHCSRTRSPIYFVLDGIDLVQEKSVKKLILDVYPIGHCDYFKFLIVTNCQEIKESYSSREFGIKLKSTNLIVSDFTEGEAIELFKDLIFVTKENVKFFFKTFKKPGHLIAIYRLLNNSSNLQVILSDPLTGLSDLYLSEWENCRIGEKEEIILAAMAFDANYHTIRYISNICQMTEEFVSEFIDKTSFLELNEKSEYVGFVSEEYKNYASSRLKSYKNMILENGLRIMLQNPDDTNSIQIVPLYYKSLGQNTQITNYLTAERLLNVYFGSNSESQIISVIKTGLEAAIKVGNEKSALEFALLESVSDIFSNSSVSEQEIRARAMLNDFDTSIKIAKQAKTKEDRLLLISQVMMWQLRKGLTPNEETKNEAKLLHANIDYSNIREKAIKISSYLLYTIPDLAVEIIERIGNSEKGNSSVDIAIAKITLSGIASCRENDTDYMNVDSLNVENSIINNVYNELRSLLMDQPIAKVLQVVENMDSKSSKLLFLRNWLLIHRKEDVDGDVTKEAMEISVESHGYNLTVSILHDISSALPYLIAEEIKIELITWFDRQVIALQTKSPSSDYVALQANISKAQIALNRDLALERLQDTILWIEENVDISIRVECLSIIRKSIQELEKKFEFDKHEHYLSECETQIDRCVDILIDRTADHYEVFQTLIRSLATYDCKKALDIIERLNTSERRDNLRKEMIETILTQPNEDRDLDFLIPILSSFEDSSLTSAIYCQIVRRLRKQKDICLNNKHVANILISKKVEGQIEDNGHLCVYLASKLIINTHLGYINNNLIDKSIAKIFEVWKNIDSSDDKLRTGFDTVYILAEHYPDLSVKFLAEIEEYRKKEIALTNKELNSLSLIINLLIHGLSALAENDAITSDDENKLGLFISHVPSKYARGILWNEYSVSLHSAGNKEKAVKVFDEKILPIIAELDNGNRITRDSLLVKVAPAYFLAHETLYLDEINKHPNKYTNSAIYEICMYVMTKLTSSNPFELSKKSKLAFSYSDIPLIFSLINKLTDESIAYTIIDNICQYVINNARLFSKSQRIDISARIDTAIDKIFIGKQPLRHNGYKLCVMIKSEMINDSITSKKYENVRMSIAKITNIADQAFIWCELAAAVKQDSDRRTCFETAKKLIELIPSLCDRLWHLEMLANLSWQSGDKIFSKQCFTLAITQLVQSQNTENKSVNGQRIIDMAHRLDPELARTLASVIENDSTNELVKEMVKKKKIEMGALDNIIGHKENAKNKGDKIDYSSVSWDALGMLNAGMISPTKVKILMEYYQGAAEEDILKSYPIYLWIVENIRKIYSNQNNCSLVIRPLVDSLVATCMFSVSYLTYLHDRRLETPRNIDCSINGLIRVGDREEYIAHLKEWFRENPGTDMIIIDPYFSLDDLEIIKYAYYENDNINITILSSFKKQKDDKIDLEQIESIYNDYWRDHFSLEELRKVKLVLLSTEPSGTCPIHDRWIIIDDVGLHLGTSINSLGKKMSRSDVECSSVIEDIKTEIKLYLSGNKKSINDEIVKCRIYIL